MKIILLAFSLIVMFQSGCKKECPPNTAPSSSATTVPGLWEGTYLTNQVTHQPNFISFSFYTDGTLLVKSKGSPPAQPIIYSKGRWSLSNNTLSFRDTTINYSSTVIQTGKFDFDSTKNVLSNGTWQDVTSDNGQFWSGTYPTMVKVQ